MCSTRLTRGHRRSVGLSVVALMFAASHAAGQSAYEPFDYPAGQALLGKTGGSGFEATGWRSFVNVAAGSLRDPTGLLATRGGHVAAGNFHAQRRVPETVGQPGTDMWVSFLMRRDLDNVGWAGLQVREAETDSQSQDVYFIGEPGSGHADGTLAIGRAVDDSTLVSSGVPLAAGETAFVVAHFDFRDGPDAATLYVNPTPGPAAPAGGVTFTGINFGPWSRPMFALDGASNSPFAVNHAFDELRVGTTYAEVAPVVPEPASGLAATGALALLALSRPKRHARRR